jgi:hypothetical protein
MSNLVFVADNKLWKYENGNTKEMTVYRIEKYKENIREIARKNEWKNTGTGAKFMGTATMTRAAAEIPESAAKVTGVVRAGDRLVYSVKFEQIGGLYYKSYDSSDTDENLIISNQDIRVEGIDCKDNRLAASLCFNNMEKHIAVFNLPSAAYTELTEGDTAEEYPCWSKTENKLYFSTAGYARNEYEAVAAISPRALACYNFDREEMETVAESEDFDYLKPQTDIHGNLYCIKRPYKTDKSSENILIDILLFPVRILKAIFGFLNIFSMLFGGESLRSGEGANAAKTKQKSQRDMFIDGNMVNVERAEKENQSRGEKYPGIIPKSWQLIKISSFGEETVIKSGVLDFSVTDSGSFIISNGNHITELLPSGEEIHICKAKMAHSIVTL